jgi:hypothetical protein
MHEPFKRYQVMDAVCMLAPHNGIESGRSQNLWAAEWHQWQGHQGGKSEFGAAFEFCTAHHYRGQKSNFIPEQGDVRM